MTPRFFTDTVFDTVLANLPWWSAQILILVAIAGAASLALSHPKARLLFWQGVLLLTLILPAIQPWRAAPVEAITTDATVLVHIAPGAAATGSWFGNLHWKPQYWLALLVAGGALWLLWIAVGRLRLRRYRLSAELLPDPPLYFVAKNVRWYVSETLGGPVTYGFLHPSILLPQRVQALPAAMREAIACHELVHVRRGDWLVVVFEELMRALLWFHPAIWFALSRIQLAREQVVDREAVRLTENRDSYLNALVAVAEHRLKPDLVPATLFLRKRHLAVRVAEMMKEVRMSRSRIAASLTAVSSAALVAARLAVWFFPLTAPAQTVVDDPGVTVDPGGKLLHRGPVHFVTDIPGTVIIEATLNDKGEVSDPRVLSGPAELRNPALTSVLGWHYLNGTPSPVQIAVRFQPPEGASKPLAAVRQPPPAPGGAPIRVKSIEFVGVSPEAEQDLRTRLQIREGDVLSPADMQRIKGAIEQFDRHLSAGFVMRVATDGTREAMLRITVPPTVNGSAPLPAAAPAPALPNTIRIGGNAQSTKIVEKTTPAYPPLAKQSRVQGTVELSVHIGADGAVKDVELISGHPLLAQAAIDAVKQWVYQPTLLNGNPVDVLTVVDVNFTLSQ